jgi:hypothetical protein
MWLSGKGSHCDDLGIGICFVVQGEEQNLASNVKLCGLESFVGK